MKHKTNNALFRGGTALGDLAVDRVHLLDLLRRIRHQLCMLLAFIGDLDVLSLDGLPQPAKHVVPGVDGAEEVTDGAHHSLDGIVVAPVTERDELLTRLTFVPTRHPRVGVDRRGTGDMGAGQDGDAVVTFIKPEVESSCTLEVGVVEGCDRETEGGGERLSQVGDVVEEGVKREEFGASSDGTSDYRLDKGHLNGGEASLSEDGLDDTGSGNGGFVEEGVRLYTDGEDKRAEGLGFSGVGIGKGVDERPLYANGIEVAADARADREPSVLNGVTVDRASLTFNALGLRAFAGVPVRARLEYAGRAAAIEVFIGVGVVFSQAGRRGDVVVRGQERELERGGSRGDGRLGEGDGRLVPDLIWYG